MRFSELEHLQPRNPYIWRESFNTCPTSCSARMRRCSALPYLGSGKKTSGVSQMQMCSYSSIRVFLIILYDCIHVFYIHGCTLMPKALNQEGECDISSCTRPGIKNKPVFMETKMLKKLLDDIVAENIGGQLVHPQALFHPCIWPRSGEEKSWTQKNGSQINITISDISQFPRTFIEILER